MLRAKGPSRLPTFARAFRRGLPVVALLAVAPLGGLGAAALAIGPAAAAAACTGDVAGVSVYGGGGQVAKVGTAFSTPLEAEVVDSGGCPVANAPVEFVLPASGASGFFPGNAINVTVPTASNGVATAPTVTANEITGSFNVEASEGTFATEFDLTNTTVGAVSSLAASSGNDQSADIGDAFGEPLEVTVDDAYGDPVVGTTVDFEVVTTAGAGATFQGGGASATVETNQDGLAISPALTAGDTAGAFTVTATVSGISSMVTFSLDARAGVPSTLAAGVGSSQNTELGTDFAVPLVVTVTDTDNNPVVGATVTFSAPASGASGVFAGAGTRATVLTNSDGIATAPDFSANEHTGGYVVMASVADIASPATFALVNEPRPGASVPGPDGTYWLVTSTGSVLKSGDAKSYGSLADKKVGKVVGIAATPDGKGYWLVTSKGSVYRFGDAVNYGPPAGRKLNGAVVGIAATPDGKGYWLATSKGSVYRFGDAVNYGSAAGKKLNGAVVGIAATPDGKGYWLAAADGGVFNYGDAKFFGPTGHTHPVKPVVGIAITPGGTGYWLVTSNGDVLAFGKATSFSSGAHFSPQPVIAIVATADGAGYWIVSANGTVAAFGDAGAQGSPTLSAKSASVMGGAG